MKRKMVDPWVSHPHIWKTKAAFFSFLRGGIRRGIWERNPAKIDFKNKIMELPPASYTGRGKSGQKCALSGTWYNKSALEVDHIEGNVSLNDWCDVEDFIKHLTCVGDNMQVVGRAEHKIKSHAEKYGMTYDEAAWDKIAIEKTKGSVLKVKRDMLGRGASTSQMSNGKTRRAFYYELAKSGKLK